MRDLGIRDLGGIHGHLAGEVERRPLAFRQVLVVALQGTEPRLVEAGTPQVGLGVRHAVFATVGVAGDPSHLAAEHRPERIARPVQEIQPEHRGRRPRHRAGHRPRPGRQGPGPPAPLGRRELPPAFLVAQQGEDASHRLAGRRGREVGGQEQGHHRQQGPEIDHSGHARGSSVR